MPGNYIHTSIVFFKYTFQISICIETGEFETCRSLHEKLKKYKSRYMVYIYIYIYFFSKQNSAPMHAAEKGVVLKHLTPNFLMQ